MSIVAVGCSHTSAPLALLEPLSVPASEVSAVLARLKSMTHETLIISTCNRTEVYAVVEHSRSSAEFVLQLFAERSGTSAGELRQHLYVRTDADAVRHAFRVTSGLDSMVLGEDQIQAQWKRALAHARMAQTLGPVLDRLGDAALSCGKRVRAHTGIGRHSVSLETLAVRAAADRLSGLNGRNVLLIGTGDAARLIARPLRAASPARITVVSRSLDKAEEFARDIEATAARIDDLPHVLTNADAVFCCTSAPHAVLAADHLRERAAARPGQTLVCVDLGMPRDVDPSVAGVAGVQVVSYAELEALAGGHREERRHHLPAAESIVTAEVARFIEWRTARGHAATIARLHAHARSIAEAELSIAQGRLATLSTRDREVVSDLARRIVKKLLHTPSEVLQHHPRAENIAFALECAFGLSGTAHALDSRVTADRDELASAGSAEDAT